MKVNLNSRLAPPLPCLTHRYEQDHAARQQQEDEDVGRGFSYGFPYPVRRRVDRAARASASDKGSGPVLVPVGEEVAPLASLSVARVADLPRRIVGRVNMDRSLVLRLERLGIKILGDMLALPLDRLPRVLRPTGHLLRDLAYGIEFKFQKGPI